MAVTRIADFDTWRPGYAGATLTVYRAGSSVLADVFLNENMTVTGENPQILLTLVEDGISYGKLQAPLYVEQAFQLNIDNIDTTGVIRPPLTTLTGEDASGALVTPEGAVVAHTLADHTARVIYVLDSGPFLETGQPGASSATNNATLVIAIGTAGAQGGGEVRLPPGVYDFIDITIPDGVVVTAPAEAATFLQSTYAGPVVTIGGPRAGLKYVTIDGVSQQVNSVGVYGVSADDAQFEKVTIKRFETGAYERGGERGNLVGLTVSDCVTGAKLHGDLNAGAGGGGENFQANRWVGGRIEFCTTGIELKRVDAVCGFNTLNGVSFIDNTGAALKIVGARSTAAIDCIFEGNTINIDIADGSPVDVNNTVVGFTMLRGRISGGTMALSGTLQDVIFDSVELSDVDITLTNPLHNVLAIDCREDSLVTLAGSSTNWIRQTRTDDGASFGITTGNAATKAWAITLESGQRTLLEARVVARRRNGTQGAYYYFVVNAERAPATLNYDTQTGNFTVGNIITGGTSGATARLIADADAGTTGTLSLQDVDGVFVDNELLTDGATGSATANGGITEGTTSAGSPVQLFGPLESDPTWAAAFVANGPEIELRVTGATGMTVEWTCDVKVTTT